MAGQFSEDKREKSGDNCSGASAPMLEAGRKDEQMGQRLGLLTGAYFSRFSTKSRPAMGYRLGPEGWGRKCHHLLS